MWDTYEEYCSFMESKGCEPVSKEIFNRDYRRKTEEEKEAEKLKQLNFVSRKKESFKNLEPTLSNHGMIKKPKKTVIKKSVTTRSDHVPAIGKMVQSPKPKAVKPIQEPKPLRVKMSEEERALRHREQRMREYARRKAVRAKRREERGLEPCVRICKQSMSPEEKRALEKEQKRLQAIRYRERIKNDPVRRELKRQRDRENQRRFQEKNRERHARWVEKNPERAKEHYQKWAKSNPEAIKEKQRLHKEVRRADPEYRAKEAANARAYRARKRMSCSAEMSCSA